MPLPLFAAILQMTTIKVCFVAKHTGQTVTACGIPGVNWGPRFPFLNVNKLYRNPHYDDPNAQPEGTRAFCPRVNKWNIRPMVSRSWDGTDCWSSGKRWPSG